MKPEEISNATDWRNLDWSAIDRSKLDPAKINPRAVERFLREKDERAIAEAKSKAREALHWTRAMVEEAIEEAKAQGSLGVVNGQEVHNAVNLHGKNLDGVDCSGLDLENVNLHGSSCKGTRFVGSKLKGANFHGADLGSEIAGVDGANFSDADIDGANFCQSCICRCIFHGSKLKAVACNFSECCCEAIDGLTLREIKGKGQDGVTVKRLVGDDRFDRSNWTDAKRTHTA